MGEGKERRDDIRELDKERVVICNGQSKVLSCLNGKSLQIESVFYGKKSGQDCKGDLPYKDDSLFCSILNAKKTIKNTCNGWPTCSILADDKIFGYDSCKNVNKYIEIVFRCLPLPAKISMLALKRKDPSLIKGKDKEPLKPSIYDGQKNFTVMVCNGERHTISCQRDVGMLINNAFYGKKNGIDCRGDIPYKDDIPDCVNPRALASVKFLCENRKSCELVSEK